MLEHPNTYLGTLTLFLARETGFPCLQSQYTIRIMSVKKIHTFFLEREKGRNEDESRPERVVYTYITML